MNKKTFATMGSWFPHRAIRLSVVPGLVCLLLQGQVFAGDVFKGKELYQTHCEACHGAGGSSIVPSAPSFSRGQGLMQPDRSLFETIRSGKNAMPAYQGLLSDREIFDVISYIRTLR